MKTLDIYYNDIKAGELIEYVYTGYGTSYIFKYDEEYLKSDNPPVSLTLPKRKKDYKSKELFSCFSNLYCFHNGKMVETCSFDLLCECKGDDFIGSINVK